MDRAPGTPVIDIINREVTLNPKLHHSYVVQKAISNMKSYFCFFDQQHITNVFSKLSWEQLFAANLTRLESDVQHQAGLGTFASAHIGQ